MRSWRARCGGQIGGGNVPCAHDSSVPRRAPGLWGSRGAGAALYQNTVAGGGTSLTLIYARGCDSALTEVRGQAPLSLPCRNLAHNMLAAIYKHDFKPATADAIAIGVACTPPLPGRFIGPLSYLWRTVVVFSESWVIFLSTRVSLG